MAFSKPICRDYIYALQLFKQQTRTFHTRTSKIPQRKNLDKMKLLNCTLLVLLLVACAFANNAHQRAKRRGK